MTERLPTPLDQINLRLPEAGRIRCGEKGGRQGRRAIPNFRFTSRDQDALQTLADLYGGTVSPWRDRSVAAGQYELRTSANQIEVALPPDPLSMYYEQWSAGGCQRRCTGTTCAQTVPGPDGPEVHDVPCLCVAEGAMSCKLKVRLSVLLPEVRGIGTWRLETASENAKHTFPGVVETIQAMAPGLQRATLRIEQRKEARNGQTRQFQVPVLDSAFSVTELAQGYGRIGALPEPAPPLALTEAYDVRPEVVDEMVEAIEAEVLEDVTFDEATGPHPISTDLCDKYMSEKTTHQRARSLIRARELALEKGEPVPSKVEEISYPLIDALMAEGA